MRNKTLPVPDEKGGYIAQLAVFHQLHCLVSVPLVKHELPLMIKAEPSSIWNLRSCRYEKSGRVTGYRAS
jgi:hypothetical protein